MRGNWQQHIWHFCIKTQQKGFIGWIFTISIFTEKLFCLCFVTSQTAADCSAVCCLRQQLVRKGVNKLWDTRDHPACWEDADAAEELKWWCVHVMRKMSVRAVKSCRLSSCLSSCWASLFTSVYTKPSSSLFSGFSSRPLTIWCKYKNHAAAFSCTLTGINCMNVR